MPNLKEQLRIARVNLMKRRAAEAWHRAHCEKCRPVDPLARILAALTEEKAGSLVETSPGEFIPTAH